MKKTILKMTFDSKKDAVGVRTYRIRSSNAERDDATILSAFMSGIVWKLKDMPIDKKTARKFFDFICEEMEALFCKAFPDSEEEEIK